jgi:hypothetical protein
VVLQSLLHDRSIEPHADAQFPVIELLNALRSHKHGWPDILPVYQVTASLNLHEPVSPIRNPPALPEDSRSLTEVMELREKLGNRGFALAHGAG